MASFEVPTPSMEDTVMVGDCLLVNKLVYGGTTPYTIPFTSIRLPTLRVPGWRDVARGDVIVFDWPGERDQVEKPARMWYLKRCIGLPGDTVQISGREVFVNGEAVSLPPKAKFARLSRIEARMVNPRIFPKGPDLPWVQAVKLPPTQTPFPVRVRQFQSGREGS